MQRLLSIILVLSLFSYQSYHSLIYLNYLANKSYFANVLCVNKNNPEKQGCNGKCHLKKQLEKKKPVENPNPFSEAATISFYPELLAVLLNKINLPNQNNLRNSQESHIYFSLLTPHLTDIFHPPKLF